MFICEVLYVFKIKLKMIKKKILLVVAASLFTTIFRILFPDLYSNDVNIFISWNDFTDTFNNVYNTDCFCNYPIVGLLFSSGILKFFNNDTFPFLIFLAIFDTVNIFIFYKILLKTKVKKPEYWSIVFAVLPAVWSAGSLWGQIDNIGLSFILLLVLMILHLDFDTQKRNKTWLFYMGIIMSLALLLKQLTVFTILPLFFLIITLIIKEKQNKLLTFSYICLIILGLLFPIIIFDLWLKFPSNYISHIEKIVLYGSNHMDKISGNGINIWMLLNRDMWSSSLTPFYHSLTPKNTGRLLFLVLSALTGLLLFLNVFSSSTKATKKTIVLNFILYICLINISFNLFLSGTHERYLFYFYPIMLLYILIKHKNKYDIEKSLLFSLTIIGNVIYAAFIIGMLLNLRYKDSHITLLFFHLIFYFILLKDFIQNTSGFSNIKKLFSY